MILSKDDISWDPASEALLLHHRLRELAPHRYLVRKKAPGREPRTCTPVHPEIDIRAPVSLSTSARGFKFEMVNVQQFLYCTPKAGLGPHMHP
jgi:hypothetical protein